MPSEGPLGEGDLWVEPGCLKLWEGNLVVVQYLNYFKSWTEKNIQQAENTQLLLSFIRLEGAGISWRTLCCCTSRRHSSVRGLTCSCLWPPGTPGTFLTSPEGPCLTSLRPWGSKGTCGPHPGKAEETVFQKKSKNSGISVPQCLFYFLMYFSVNAFNTAPEDELSCNSHAKMRFQHTVSLRD